MYHDGKTLFGLLLDVGKSSFEIGFHLHLRYFGKDINQSCLELQAFVFLCCCKVWPENGRKNIRLPIYLYAVDANR